MSQRIVVVALSTLVLATALVDAAEARKRKRDRGRKAAATFFGSTVPGLVTNRAASTS